MKNRALQIKVCGMREPGNIVDVAMQKPDLMGFIYVKKSKRYVGKDFHPSVLMGLPSTIQAVGVFVNEPIKKLKGLLKSHPFAMVQLHGDESPSYCEELKKEGLKIIKVFRIENAEDFSPCQEYKDVADFYLFDTRSNSQSALSAASYGGSGKKFDWNVLEEYPGSLPYFLSGGLGPEDVESIKKLPKDYPLIGLDINSKFETKPAIKDARLVGEFIKAIKT